MVKGVVSKKLPEQYCCYDKLISRWGLIKLSYQSNFWASIFDFLFFHLHKLLKSYIENKESINQKKTCITYTNHFWTRSLVHQGCWENPLGSWSSYTGQLEHGSEKTHSNSITHSISHTLFFLMNNYDLLRPHKRTAERETIIPGDSRQLETRQGEEKRGWCVKKVRTEKAIKSWVKAKIKKRKKENQCSTFLLCSVSFSQCGLSPWGNVKEKWDAAKRVGKGKWQKWLTSIKTVNTWQVNKR